MPKKILNKKEVYTSPKLVQLKSINTSTKTNNTGGADDGHVSQNKHS